jgi:hypothetical protein
MVVFHGIFCLLGKYKNSRIEKCVTIGVSQIFKMFHAIKFDGQLHG